GLRVVPLPARRISDSLALGHWAGVEAKYSGRDGPANSSATSTRIADSLMVGCTMLQGDIAYANGTQDYDADPEFVDDLDQAACGLELEHGPDVNLGGGATSVCCLGRPAHLDRSLEPPTGSCHSAHLASRRRLRFLSHCYPSQVTAWVKVA